MDCPRVKWCELKNSDQGDQCMVGWKTWFGIFSGFWEVESAGLMVFNTGFRSKLASK